MTQRRLWLSAVALALLVQAAFVAAYHDGTSGCFCAITTSKPGPPAFVTWAFVVGSMPLRQLMEGTELQVGGLIPTLIFAALNSVFWTVGFVALLNLVALVCRLRLDRTSGTNRRFRLHSLAEVKPGSMVTGLLLLAAAGLVFGAQYRLRWLSSAKEAVQVAVGSVRAGEPFHKSGRYDIQCCDACRPEQFTGSFSLKRDPGGHPLDVFVAPIEFAGTLEFARGSRYLVRVYRIEGLWSVILGPDW